MNEVSGVPARDLGDGLAVSAVGVGTMGLSPGVYGDIEEADAIAVIRDALDAGATFVDTADAYGGGGGGERMVGKAIVGRREEVVLATKFGYVGPDQGRRIEIGYRMKLFVDGSPAHVASAIDASLDRLGVDHVDLWFLHHPDPEVPIEDTVAAMARQVQAGKVRHLGLSNVTGDHVRRAAAVHPIAAVQNEYSLWNRSAEADLLPACREVGAGFVSWGPLGTCFLADRRFLTGAVTEVPKQDFRSRNERFSAENLAANADRFAPLVDIAERLECTTAQLALAWLVERGAVPIPGTRNAAHLKDNLAAVTVRLEEPTLSELDTRFPVGAGVGRTF